MVSASDTGGMNAGACNASQAWNRCKGQMKHEVWGTAITMSEMADRYVGKCCNLCGGRCCYLLLFVLRASAAIKPQWETMSRQLAKLRLSTETVEPRCMHKAS